MDNYFTTYQILELLKTKGMNAAGTIRVNRFNKPPLLSDSVMKKKERGYGEEVTSLEACSSLEVDLDMVESVRQLEHPHWIGDNMENVNTQMTVIPKGTATARIKAEMDQTIEEEGLEENVRVHTDGSL
jgi:hypothetical protein